MADDQHARQCRDHDLYFSAGSGCGGGASANFTTSGSTIQVSLCADTTTEGLCGATVYPQVGSSMQNGHFRITARTLSSGITDPSSSITFPVDLTNPPDNGSYINNFGGSRPAGSPNAPAASAGQVLMTFDIAPQSSAVNSSYTLNLDASEINTTAPATSCFAAFNTDPISATFTFNRVIAPAFTSATSTTFTYNSFGSFSVTATGTPAPTFSATAGTLPSGVTLSSAGVLSGTPTQGGTFPVTLTATNGVNPDATQSFTLTVNPISQTITFPVQTVTSRGFVPSGTFAIDPTATASSGLAVTYSSTTTGVCTVSGTTVTIVSAGTCTLAANQAGDTNYTAATQVTRNVTITQASQTITFPVQTVTSRSFVPSGTFAINPLATASSGLAVTHSSLTTGVCTVSGTSVTIVAVGTCTLAANQAGDTNYSAATQQTRDVTITQASQTITFGANPGPVAYAPSGTFMVSATGGASGNAVTFASTTTGVCTNVGSTVTIVAAGTCTIAANQAGNANYAAATQVTQNITINLASQTITFPVQTVTSRGFVPSGTFAIDPTATASSGLAVTYSSTTTGVCTVSGTTVTIVSAGTCTLAANQAGDTNYTAATQVTRNVTITQASQTITFPVQTVTSRSFVPSGTFAINPLATASSGLAVTHSSLTTGVCTVSGTSVTIVAVGTCTLAANQAGDTNYSAATQQTRDVTITQASQTITFGANPGPVAYAPSGTFMVSATGGASGNAVTFASTTTGVCTNVGSTVTIVAAGTCTIAANQAGNANYAAATQVTQNITINLASQTIAFTSSAPGAAVVAGASYTPAATATSGLTVVFTIDASASSVCSISMGVVSFQAVGTCVVNADQAGSGNYNAASQAQQSFGVGAGTQVITFTSLAPGGAVVGGATYGVSATGGASGQPVVFSIDASSSSVCTIAASTVSFTGVGTCRVNANQAGNANYNAAAQVQQSFSVGQGGQTINITSSAPGAAVVGGATYTVTATGGASGQPVVFSIAAGSASVCTIATATVSFIGAGTCTINANQAGNANYTAAPQVQQSFTVGKGSQTISFTSSAPGAAVVGGSMYTVTATGGASTQPVVFTIAAGSASVCTISTATVSFIGVGTCTINANQGSDVNYNAAPQVQQSFSVGQGSQTISFTSAAPGAAMVAGATYTPTATASSGQAVAFTIDASAASVCSISMGVVSFQSVGTCVVNANQNGNANYLPAPQVQQSFAVGKGNQTLSFTSSAPSGAVVGGATYTVMATSSASLTVALTIDATASSVCSIAGSTVSFIGVGTCVINANQGGSVNYNPAAQVQQSFAVGQGSQTITGFNAPATLPAGGSTFTLMASGGASGNSVTFATSSAGTICTVAGNVLTPVGVGACLLTANQAGNANYAAAPQVNATTSITLTYNLVLEGAQEVPANISTGTGSGTAVVDTVNNTITLNATFSGIGSLTGAHFHGNSARGVSSGVKVGLTDLTSPMSETVTYLEADESAILAGNWYLNLHTAAFPGGELRAQLDNLGAANKTLTTSVTGTGTITSAPAGINCPGDCSESYVHNTVVTLTATPGSGYSFTGWSGACTGTGSCNVTMDFLKSVTATFTINSYALTVTKAGTGTGTVTSSPAGINCGADCTENYNHGTMVTLTATADGSSAFAGWSGGGCSGTGTCTVTITAASTVTATFTLNTYALTVTKAGTGSGTVTSSPAGISCGADCTENYNHGTAVTLTATPSTGSTFAGWSGGGCSGTGTCTVTLTAATTVTATFTLNLYSVIPSAGAGGTISPNTTQMIGHGQTTTFTVTPDVGYTASVGGTCGGSLVGTTYTTNAITGTCSVNATFTLNTYTVTPSAGSNGSIFPGTPQTVNHGATTSFSVTPAMGYVASVGGTCGGSLVGTTYTTAAITAPCTVTASFVQLITYNLVLEGAQEVPANISTGTGSGTAVVDTVNNTITLNATFSGIGSLTGAHFHGNSARGVSSGVKVGLTDLTSPMSETVTYLEADESAILAGNWYLNLHTSAFPGGELRAQLDNLGAANKTLTTSVTGTGTITSAPAGINCPGDCSESYVHNTVVTLTATPGSGYSFTGWSGACTGTGSCNVTMDFLKSVTATFTINSYALTVTKAGTGTGTVTSSPAGINCGADCTENYNHGTMVTLTATADASSTFAGWTGACTGTGMCTVTMDAAKSVTATFTLNTYALTVTKAGTGSGTVTSSPAGISCGATCSANYNHGTMVTLTATPSTGSTFAGWSGGGCTGTGTCTVTMTAANTVTATFTLNTYSVTPSAGANGTISPNVVQTVGHGSTTSFTVTPSGGYFAVVGGTCGGSLVGNTYTTNAITANCTVDATFTQNTYAVTPSAGANGSISPNTAQTVAHGATTQFTVTPNSGYSASVGGTCGGSLVGNTYTTNAITAACTVSATFTLNTYTVTPSAGANGSISPSMAVTVNHGSTTTFTVTPAMGYVASVGGTCGGSLVGTTYTTAAITAPCTVTASFVQLITYNLVLEGAQEVPANISTGTGSGTAVVDTVNNTITLNATFSGIGSLTGAHFHGNSARGVSSGVKVGLTDLTSPMSETVTYLEADESAILAGNWYLNLHTAAFPGGELRAQLDNLGAANKTLTTSVTGTGTITSAPAGINCPGDCSESYVHNTVVTLTATPGSGYSFTGWSGACTGTGSCNVTMDFLKSVTATFTINSYALTVTKAGTGTGTVTSSPAGINCGADCTENYNHGTMVTLTATADGSSAFAGWTGACTGTGTCTVTMDAAKSVTATFTLNTYALTVTKAGTGSGTVTSSPAGINCGADCTENYNHGTMVTLTATADASSTFAGWTGACTGTGMCTVTMDAAKSVTATFTLNTYALTVTKAGTGSGTVTSSPAGINCGADCTENYNHGTMVTLTATADGSSAFAGWTGACTGTGTCTVTMDAAKSVTATFTLNTYALTVTKAGTGSGTVTSSPAGINCGADCTENYNHGTMVTLTATADASSTFAGWTGACTGTSMCTVTMDAAKSVSATFTINSYALTVTRNGTGTGTVTSSPAGINCGADCSENYNHGTMVTLTASADVSSTFAGWSGGGCSGTGTCTVSMTAATTVTATFTINSYTVIPFSGGNGTISPNANQSVNHGSTIAFTVTPSVGYSASVGGTCGGTLVGNTFTTAPITATCLVNATFTINSYALTTVIAGTGSGAISGTGIACPGDCTENFTHGTMVTLTATANTGSTFAGWSGGGCTGTGTCTVSMTAATSVTATFTINSYALTVTKAGTGSGTVTSSPAGINCGATCSANYNHGIAVTLTASTDVSSTFAGWTGACTGTGSCTVTMDAAKSVTATFTLNSHALNVSKVGAGTVTSTPAGIACGATCTANYTHGTMVTLTATPDVSTTFTGWSGACSGSMACTVTMDAVKNVTATFTTKTYTVTPSAGSNGSISPNAPQTIAHGSTTSFAVTPNAGFSATVGGTCGGSLSGNTFTTNAITANCTVDASFAVNIAFVEVVSRKFHGTTKRDLPVTGTNTVEPRQAQSGGHLLVFRFDAPVTNPGMVSIVTQPVSGATATVAIGADNTEVIVTLSGVPEIARATVTLSNVNGVAGGIARIGYLPGDVNGSGLVTAADIAYIKAQSGTPNTNNYKADVNASGGFNSVDISAAKAKAGMVLP